jgi:hypothetical protein
MVFTFGFGQRCVCGRPLDSCYTVRESRDEMVRIWGRTWSFCYPTAADAGVERFNLQEIVTNADDPSLCPCGHGVPPVSD